MTHYAVILFGAADNPDPPCALSQCPTDVRLFKTRAEAEAWAGQQPDWTEPHVLPAFTQPEESA
jgi:hypothetical protein